MMIRLLALMAVLGGSLAYAVSVDLVVRDKHGHAVKDLRADEVRITEDGAPAKIESFRLASTPGAGGAKATHFVSIVLDGTADAVDALGRDGISEISKQLGSDLFVSVWRIGDRLTLLQNFTNDEEALRKTIPVVGRNQRKQVGNAIPVASGASGMSAATRQQLSDAVTNVLTSSERYIREQHARPTIAGLLALAKEENLIPGRKAALYVSDGVGISTATETQLRAIAGEANRSTLSFYTVDGSGVSDRAREAAAHMLTDTVGMASHDRATASYIQANSATDYGLTTSYDPLKERPKGVEPSQIKELSTETGGFYGGRSGEIRKLVRGLVEDTTTYYEVDFAAGMKKYDGHFLAVNVKVVRPAVRVQSRAGFFSLPPGAAMDIQSFELPLFAALESASRSETIWFDARIFRPALRGNEAPASLLVQVPLSGLIAREDDTAKIFRMHLSLAALVKDSDGKMVQKLSQDVGLQGALEQLQQARKDVFTFERRFVVAPGDYHVDIAIEDQNAAKISSKTIACALPHHPEGLELSDLMVVRRLEPLASKADNLGLLHYKDMRVIPDLNSRHIPVADSRHPVFFEILADSNARDEPQIQAELKHGATKIAHLPIQVSEHKPGEPVTALVSLNDAPSSGDYTLLVTVTQGSSSRRQQVSFALPEDPGEAEASNAALTEDQNPEITSYTKFAAVPQLLAHAQRPGGSEIQAILKGARARVEDYKKSLPNFVCMTVTKRFVDPTGHGAWKARDSFVHLLRYVDGRETTVLLDVDGHRPTGSDTDTQGANVKGEFGELLSMVVAEKAKAHIEWQGQADISGARTHVFRFGVSRPDSMYQVIIGATGTGYATVAAYRALVYIDTNTLAVRRISVEAEDLPKDFHIRESAISVDYDYVPIGGQQHLLPLRATLFVRQGARYLRRNEIDFQNYRKYGAESTLKISQ
ncbi:MAG: VWA domain-containing protein [Acidobacteriaceae bacterium]|nr:VWA domain-containing protein [Acidobacteriaceae bacterium]